MSELVDVVAIQVKPPHTKRRMASNLTPENAEAFIKMAIIRRGVDVEFYSTEPSEPLSSG